MNNCRDPPPPFPTKQLCICQTLIYSHIDGFDGLVELLLMLFLAPFDHGLILLVEFVSRLRLERHPAGHQLVVLLLYMAELLLQGREGQLQRLLLVSQHLQGRNVFFSD